MSIIPGVLAVLAFLFLVRDPEQSPNPALRFAGALRNLPARFKRCLGAVGLFGIGDFSHSLLILAATQLLTASMGVVQAAQVAGLLYVGRNLVQVLVSYPVGALATESAPVRCCWLATGSVRSPQHSRLPRSGGVSTVCGCWQACSAWPGSTWRCRKPWSPWSLQRWSAPRHSTSA